MSYKEYVVYVQDCIDDWRDIFDPDIYSQTKDPFNPSSWKGSAFQFGELVVSIQWGKYNFCDDYEGKYNKTKSAEIAIICKSRFDFRYDWVSYWFVLFDEHEHIKTYANISEIEDILRVCRDYARA